MKYTTLPYTGIHNKSIWYLLQIYEYRQAKRDLRDVESLRQTCGLFDVIEIAVPRKNLVAYLGTFQSSITRNSLIPGRIEVKLVSMKLERFILHVYNKIFVLLCI